MSSVVSSGEGSFSSLIFNTGREDASPLPFVYKEMNFSFQPSGGRPAGSQGVRSGCVQLHKQQQLVPVKDSHACLLSGISFSGNPSNTEINYEGGKGYSLLPVK